MAALEALPTELVENIVTNLGLCDIRSLRLTCRTMEAKASGLSFTTFFGHKNIQLTATALQNFVDVTGQCRLGCLLQDCTITGIASNETTTADETAEHIRLLADAFRNLKSRSPRGGLVSLTLGLVARVEAEGELMPLTDRRVSRAWHIVWDAAVRTFRVVMAALEKSQMSVGEHLSVFGGVAGCSLACDVFVAYARAFSSAHVFGSLKRLTMRLSAPYRAESEPELERRPIAEGRYHLITEPQDRHAQQVFRAVVQLSHATRALEGLDLHWYNLGRYVSSVLPDFPEEDSTGTSSETMHIKSCILRGIFVSETNLLGFLQTTRPEDLTLADVSIIPGKIDSILDFLNGQDSSVTSYHLKDIIQGCLLHFNVPGRSRIPYTSGSFGPSTLTRGASDAKEAVSYTRPRGRPLGSGGLYSWRRYKKEEYGPIQCDGLMYIGQKYSFED
ncbi:hypothetical protein VMCG_05698 [Cytospora schulzeri]|uniref:F-box domain-containing protein n=1 Tax=Cytospora schulzeri TaxID=448051 RepID=A0A423WI27_9PEZI|nr:hypothetical protein VMCG_05698 [Valsa malicola]